MPSAAAKLAAAAAESGWALVVVGMMSSPEYVTTAADAVARDTARINMVDDSFR